MNPDAIDWERQRAFLAVLRTGSLSGAARALGLAQPTVRRRIEDLEQVLGTALFTRTPAGLTPTEIALALREHAEGMALAAETFARSASAEAGAVAGRVRVSASEVVSIEVLPAILAPLLAAHPALVIELSPSNRREDILRREADIAVRMARPEQDALLARHIGAVPLGLHAHRDYLARRGTPASFAEAEGHTLIGVETDNDVVRGMRAAGSPIMAMRFAFRTDSDLAQLAAIRAGLGIGLCQVPLAARDPALVPLIPDYRIDLDTWVVTHEDLRAVARVRAVFDALVEGLLAYLGKPRL